MAGQLGSFSRATFLNNLLCRVWSIVSLSIYPRCVIPEASNLALNDAFWRLVDHCGLGVGVGVDEDLTRRGPDHKRLRLVGRDRLGLDDDCL